MELDFLLQGMCQGVPEVTERRELGPDRVVSRLLCSLHKAGASESTGFSQPSCAIARRQPRIRGHPGARGLSRY